ncbi:MAG: TIGR02186 family protein [Alphaproteobacteria bacterium]
MGWRRQCLAIAALAVLCAPATSRAQGLVTDISEHLISITSSFTGKDLLLFGALDAGGGDIVVVVRGPDNDLVVRRKGLIAGIWVNRKAVTYQQVPGYYAVLSSRPLEQIASAAALERLGIGIGNLKFDTPSSAVRPGGEFQQAVVRLKRAQGLFKANPDGVVFLGDTLFRATVSLPANVPNGVFKAAVYLFRDGQVHAAQTAPLYVNKVGFERLVFNLAQEQPLVYGIVAVLIALFAGWLASVMFRRN